MESPEVKALAPYERWSGVPAAALGYDLVNAQTIVSFGAPMLDGWGIPGRFTRLWAERAADRSDPQLRLIQIDNSFSRTAAKAWRWLKVKPGSEGALATGLARVLLDERLVPVHGPVPRLTVAEAADQAGVGRDTIRDLARAIIAKPPVIAIPWDENPEVAALNVIMGAVSPHGGIVRRRTAFQTKTACRPPLQASVTGSRNSSMPPSSRDEALSNARAVLIDASVPWDFAPQTDAEIFRFAAWDGASGRADWLLPAPGFLEEFTDVPTAPSSEVETYAIAPQLTKPVHQVQGAGQFLAGLDPTLPSPEQIIHSRCGDLYKLRQGSVHAREITPAAQFESAPKLEEQLTAGAIWIGDPAPPGNLKCELHEWPQGMATKREGDWAASWTSPILPPLATKLYRESNLREAPERRTV